MKQLARNPCAQVIDLFHSTTELAPDALAKLTADVAAANVKPHVMIDSRDGFLTGEKLRKAVPDWQSASAWFCGPAGFGTARDVSVATVFDGPLSTLYDGLTDRQSLRFF